MAPRLVRLDEPITTTTTVDPERVPGEGSTVVGDLLAHLVRRRDALHLADGRHRTLRAALQQRCLIHPRVLPL